MNLRAIRDKAGLTQRDMAATLGITAAYMNDLEHDRRQLTDARIMACSDATIRTSLIAERVREYQAKIWMLRASKPIYLDPRKRFTVQAGE